MAIAGKVMLMPRGIYDPTAVYNILDIVRYGNKPWICRKSGTVGITPSEDNPDYWMLFIDVSISDADTLDGHDSEYFATAADFARITGAPPTAIFSVSGWSSSAPYTQEVVVDIITANDVPIPLFVDDGDNEEDSKEKLKSYGYVTYFDSDAGSIIATCKYHKPTIDFKVAFKGV